jgi:DNA-binding NarL/FixJ family response regulator
MTADLAQSRPTQVLIVDDAASTRRFLRGVLEYCPEFEVAGEAENGAQAVEMADELQPDVVLLDLSMPMADGSTALGLLRIVAPDARIVILSGTDAKAAAPLIAAGATAFVPKGLAPFDLLERLGAILHQPVTLRRAEPDKTVAVVGASGPDVDEVADVVELAPRDEPRPQAQVQARAIVCDDDPMARRLIAQVLANCNVPLLAETDSVPHLLSVVALAQPEILVLDLWLEGTPGTTAIPDVRRLSPRTLVVVYSAYEEWKDKALASGAAAFVLKPHFDELEMELHRLTKTARS